MSENKTEFKKTYLLTCLIFLLFSSCGYSQQNNKKNNNDTIFYKATLKPLKVDSPTEKTKIIKSENAFSLNIIISGNTIAANLHNHITQLNDTNSLQKFLFDNETKIDKTNIIITNYKNASIDKFKEVVATLNKNGITKFRIVSH